MKIATNIISIEGFGYQLIVDDVKRIVSINLLYNNKILVKNKLAEPIVINNDTVIKDLVDTTVLEYMNNRINRQMSNPKTKKTTADFYANVMSSKKK